MLLLKSFLITLPVLGILSMPNYYWRPYDGKIPPDAVTAGDEVYIGRAPFEGQRMLLGQITAGVRNLTVTTSSEFNYNLVHVVEANLTEILCSPLPHTSLQWVPATFQTVTNISGKVEGGYEPIADGNSLGVLHVGRIHYGRTSKVGKVVAYHPFKKYGVNNFFYYASDRGVEVWQESFEVLVYNERRDENMCPTKDKKIWYPEHYWRKYNGEVPCDAALFKEEYWDYGGAFYIGRTQFESSGILVGPIPRGAKYVIVTHNWATPPKIDKFVEILCKPLHSPFKWVATTNENILDVSRKVVGGFERNGVLYIGAKKLEKFWEIGKILGYHKKTDATWRNNKMYYAYNNKEHVTNDYYVLTYDKQ